MCIIIAVAEFRGRSGVLAVFCTAETQPTVITGRGRCVECDCICYSFSAERESPEKGKERTVYKVNTVNGDYRSRALCGAWHGGVCYSFSTERETGCVGQRNLQRVTHLSSSQRPRSGVRTHPADRET
ncbi:hypothetical protein NDU88_009257 [Pleurodeles waltl]|uniref:Secreted protein n=1 Tax=Pleurodeles waltl TaxID=8319 RepID=A0AAV7RZW7_PLEWA|nr:hypothetical protein NDU88_009257 [Pleurodeles waltl]